MNYPQQQPRSFFGRFFGGIGAFITWLRNTLMNIIFLIFLIIIIVAISSKTEKTLPEKFALRIAPAGVLVDQRSYMDTASMLLSDEDKDTETVVRDIVDAIHRAADDDRIASIVLELGELEGGGITKMEEIGQALNAFKAKQKSIIAVSDNYSQDQYYLASFANEIYLHNMGEVQLTGFGRYITYYKTALEKLGVNVHVFRSGKYKDYVEPYLRDNMSDESREHNSQWLNQLWAQYTNHVEAQRKLPAGSLNELINHLDTKLAAVKGNSAQLALSENLVDKLVDRKTIDDLLIEKFGKDDDDDFYNGIGVHTYNNEAKLLNLAKSEKIGLIVASGTIVDGRQPEGTIGSESYVELLRDVTKDEDIKALVIRIDSGGGSAFASEIIRNEIAAVRAQGIPVFISMGTLAASGGYWIATAGDEIWAMPTTITGSIGVFGAFPTLENSLQKIGLNTDGVSTTELGGAPRLDRPLPPKMSNIIQNGVDHIYQRFLQLVADARKKEVAEINEVAQGRVWTGKEALEKGLVDHLGNLNDVIAAAAEKAKVSDYSVKVLTQKLSPREELVRKLVGENARGFIPKTLLKPYAEIAVLQKQLSPLLQPLMALQYMTDPQGIYATCLECIAP
ncbi:MAG: signal peptide peptidase SppA [Pseudomonadota bacterium]